MKIKAEKVKVLIEKSKNAEVTSEASTEQQHLQNSDGESDEEVFTTKLSFAVKNSVCFFRNWVLSPLTNFSFHEHEAD